MTHNNRDPEGADFDLERALWDMDYRRQVLDALRRARRRAGDPAIPEHSPHSTKRKP